MANRPPSKTDFFNVYSARSSKREANSFQVTHRREPSNESLAVLQTTNRSYAAGKQWEERHDQRVPSNMAGSCSAPGKENRVFSREGPSSSKCPLQKERLSDTENKRSTSQILALFSSRKNIPLPKMALDGQTVEVSEANSGVMKKETQLCNLYDTADKFPPQVDAVKFIAQTANNISDIANALRPSILDNDSLGQVLETGEDLGDSLNLSPDSFAACSRENFGFHFHGVEAMCEDPTQESTFTRSPDNSQRQSEVWSQNDSESVSPLMRLLTSVEKADPQGYVDVKEDGGQLCNMVRERRLLDHCSFESPDSAALGSPSSLIDPPQSPNVYSSQQSSNGVQKSALEEASSLDFVQTSSLSERNMFSCRPDIVSPLMIATDDVSTCYENMLPSQPKLDRLSINTKRLSSHPGSLFAYSKLQSEDQNNYLRNSSDSSLFRKGFSSFEQWDSSFEPHGIDDGGGNFQQCEMSPEFHPPDIEKTSQWRVAPIVATKVIPTDSRTVSIFIDNYGE